MLLLYCLHCWLKTNTQHSQFEVSVSRIAFVWPWNLPLDSKMYLRGCWLKEFPQHVLDCKIFYYIPFIKNIFLSISNKMTFETIKWLKWSFIGVKGIIILEHLGRVILLLLKHAYAMHISFSWFMEIHASPMGSKNTYSALVLWGNHYHSGYGQKGRTHTNLICV